MSLFAIILELGASFVIGLVLATWFWLRRLHLLHYMWQDHFSRVVNATVAYYLGGHVGEDGLIHLGHNEDVPPKEGMN